MAMSVHIHFADAASVSDTVRVGGALPARKASICVTRSASNESRVAAWAGCVMAPRAAVTRSDATRKAEPIRTVRRQAFTR